jgi:hypothetical protein
MDLKEKTSEAVDWPYLGQDMDRWRAVMNTIMNLQVLKIGREFS